MDWIWRGAATVITGGIPYNMPAKHLKWDASKHIIWDIGIPYEMHAS
jgi:hypothetical protein